MSNWKESLPGCFGETDLIFAGHPRDEDRAFDLLNRLRGEGVGTAALLDAAKAYLDSEGADSEHCDRQLAKISERFKPWLLD